MAVKEAAKKALMSPSNSNKSDTGGETGTSADIEAVRKWVMGGECRLFSEAEDLDISDAGISTLIASAAPSGAKTALSVLKQLNKKNQSFGSVEEAVRVAKKPSPQREPRRMRPTKLGEALRPAPTRALQQVHAPKAKVVPVPRDQS